MDYFEFYGLNPSFYLDEKKLKQLYYQKMRDLHPDMHVGSSNVSQNEVLTLSSYNNEAYNTLKDFHLRLNYLVDLFENKITRFLLFNELSKTINFC